MSTVGKVVAKVTDNHNVFEIFIFVSYDYVFCRQNWSYICAKTFRFIKKINLLNEVRRMFMNDIHRVLKNFLDIFLILHFFYFHKL